METLGKRRRLAGQMTLSAAVAGVALGATAALAGCSPTPITTYTPTPSVGASASATVSPQAEPLTSEQLLALMPESAALPDAEGAIATAYFFLSYREELFLSGDMRVWEALSEPECEFCAGTIETVTDAAQEGLVRQGGEVSFITGETRAYTVDETGEVSMRVLMDEAASSETSSDGSVETQPEKRYEVFLLMRFVDGVWRVVGVDPVKIEP